MMEKLENLCDFISGVTFGSSDAVLSPLPGYLPILRAGNIGDGLNIKDDLVWVPSAKVSEIQKLRVGDIVMCMSSGSPLVVGKNATLEYPFDGSAGAFCGIIRPKRTEQRQYLAYWFQSEQFMQWRDAQARGINIQNLRASQLKKVQIPLPPLDEQHRIAAILAKADRLRRLRRFVDELGGTYLQSVFLRMFGDPVENPMGWRIQTLKQLKTRFSYGTSEKCFSEQVGLPVLRIPNILNRKIDLEDLKYVELPENETRKLLLEYGDLVFVRTNGNPDYVGRCTVFDLKERYLFASYLIRARLDLDQINPYFLEIYLHLPAGRQVMSPYIRTTAGQSNIGMEGLGQIPTILPPLPLQQQFAAQVYRFERLRAQQRESERQAEHLFQTLLHRAFAGEM